MLFCDSLLITFLHIFLWIARFYFPALQTLLEDRDLCLRPWTRPSEWRFRATYQSQNVVKCRARHVRLVAGPEIFNECAHGRAQTKQATIDTLERDPCERWFCHKDRFGDGLTPVYAARLDQKKAITHYPLAWEWNSTDVPGIDRTEYYTKICSKCWP